MLSCLTIPVNGELAYRMPGRGVAAKTCLNFILTLSFSPVSLSRSSRAVTHRLESMIVDDPARCRLTWLRVCLLACGSVCWLAAVFENELPVGCRPARSTEGPPTCVCQS